jgi:RNA polymerase sigma-70 factor (ECF subfamily)
VEPPDTDQVSARQSPRDLLASVWDQTAPELARVVAALGIAPSAVEDVLQDAYLAAWRAPPAHASADELRRWLFRVAINRCHLEHRRLGRWLGALRRLAQGWRHAERNEAEEATRQAEEQQIVRGALERLDLRLRSILVLRYFQGFDSTEIGRILDTPAATVRSHLRTAREKLAQELKRAGYRHE